MQPTQTCILDSSDGERLRPGKGGVYMVAKKAAPEREQKNQESSALDDFLEELGEKTPDTLMLIHEGDKFAGKFRKVSIQRTKFGGALVMELEYLGGNAQVKTEDGALEEAKTGEIYGFFLSAKLLQNRIDELRPDIGDVIGVAFQGKKNSQGGNSYNKYVMKKMGAADKELSAPLSWEEAKRAAASFDQTKAANAGVNPRPLIPAQGTAPQGETQPEEPPF